MTTKRAQAVNVTRFTMTALTVRVRHYTACAKNSRDRTKGRNTGFSLVQTPVPFAGFINRILASQFSVGVSRHDVMLQRFFAQARFSTPSITNVQDLLQLLAFACPITALALYDVALDRRGTPTLAEPLVLSKTSVHDTLSSKVIASVA